MSRIRFIDACFPDCPIRNILSRICDKWTMLVLFMLKDRDVIRFKELQRSIPDISQKMLTQTLRSLEEDGLVSRKVYAEIPPRVEYSLTSRAETLLPHFGALIDWANENFEPILESRNNNSNKN